MYGNRTFSLNYSVIGLNALICAFFPTIIGTIQSSTGSYAIPLTLLFISAVIVLAITLVLRIFIKKELSLK